MVRIRVVVALRYLVHQAEEEVLNATVERARERGKERHRKRERERDIERERERERET